MKKDNSRDYKSKHFGARAISSGKNELPMKIKASKNRIKNIHLAIISTGCVAISLTATLGAMLDNYIFLSFGGSNTWVGAITMCMGITSMFCFLPIGFAVDTFDRTKLCKISGIFILLSGSIGVYSIWYSHSIGLIIYTCISTFANELSNSAVGAIFSDSLSKTETQRFFALRGMSTAAFATLSPFISIIFYFTYGNTWELAPVKKLLVALLIVSRIFHASINFMFSKVDLSLVDEFTSGSSAEEPIDTSKSSGSQNSTELESPSNSPTSAKSSKSTSPKSSNDQATESSSFSTLTTTQKLIPFIIITADSIRAMGAGMLIKFAPLFLVQELRLSPLQMNFLNLGFASTLIAFTYFGKGLVTSLGKPLSSFIYSSVALTMLYSLTYLTNPTNLKFAYLLRGGVQNAVTPIDQMILSDYTNSKDRGKWNAAVSFTQIIFAVSAFIGGKMADQNDYRFIFSISTVFYIVAISIYSPIVYFVKDSDKVFFLKSVKKPKTQ